MFKEEAVMREILCEVLYGDNMVEQKRISQILRVSIGLVNKTVARLEQIGAMSKTGRKYSVTAFKKVLLLWSSLRNLQRDIVYMTRVNLPVRKIERDLPDGSILSAYSALNYMFNEAPADYSEVWAYIPENILPEVKTRFPPNNLPSNLYILKSDTLLLENARRFSKGMSLVSVPQLYVDLWNIPSWYSKEYIALLEKKIAEIKDGILE
ncbi:MAG: hypothetical protein B2I17_01915 [Thermoplasmatales archaeon B_DKE]|nr:MAG: hypothetical protein B2I17_01915 [Thermoplasmatales archaeon B_DKE]